MVIVVPVLMPWNRLVALAEGEHEESDLILSGNKRKYDHSEKMTEEKRGTTKTFSITSLLN